MTNIKQNFQVKKVEFRHFWLSIEKVTGNAHLPLSAHAQDLAEFMADIDSQSNPLHAVLIDTYRASKCTQLNSVINPFIVMDILGECLYQQKRRLDVDVMLIDLIERIGLHISQTFIGKLPVDNLAVKNNKENNEENNGKNDDKNKETSKNRNKQSSAVIQLKNFKNTRNDNSTNNES